MQNIITMDELRRLAPAAFAKAPADRVSERYGFIPTGKLIAQLGDHGWFPVHAWQPKRSQDPLHGTHEIKFTRPKAKVRVGGVLPQLVLTNNHMARRAWKLMAGFFKLICSNGLVVSAGIGETMARIVHVGDAEVDVSEQLNTAVNRLGSACNQIDLWKQIELDSGQELRFATLAAQIRARTNEPIQGLSAGEFLTRQREEDSGHDLWTVFNVVQENSIRGGIRPLGRPLRGINSAMADIRINTRLWELAEDFADRIKNGQSLS